ncbi:hypothetical protein TVAG_110100 [Trichomonas vaginalis G3]|uniref:Uncharacterized protein n=1 Tax=Trichomonas vaginalis (strain ATCC PRA-98 / G3) TaxID=412133 RepID=A2DGL1_TRIV3|nr:hypothetical protein TVAGG3_0998080 [Trichomonas vaginalis G3]EAY20398.1 hypothetical protein TVAG_110100 [Trichomonas vaginalis G3]KAI5490556.1 hypothetical protein TVAGG3_0998080 [Trichomonas vaginalis G3]|eukprot:XP_001581384.1 hypothetical protein [Trichomonas vaginalis G3]
MIFISYYNIYHYIKLCIYGTKLIKFPGIPKKFPKWIKINYFWEKYYKPYQTINITINKEIIEYFRNETKDFSRHQVFQGRKLIDFQDLLLYNRFYTLSDEDVTPLGKFGMRDFLFRYDHNHFDGIDYSFINKVGCIFEGIFSDYAELHQADQKIIDLIKEFAKYTKFTEDFTFIEIGTPAVGTFRPTVTIDYKTGEYKWVGEFMLEKYGFKKLHVVTCRWSKKTTKR